MDNDLGVILRLNDEDKLVAAPNAYAYRVAWRNPETGDYHSPYRKKRGAKVKFGEPVREDSALGEGGAEGAYPLYKNLRSVLETSSDEALEQLNVEYEHPYDWSRTEGHDALMKALWGLADDSSKFIVNPLARDKSSRVIESYAPHHGFSVIGVPHGAYSILPKSDLYWEQREDAGPLYIGDMVEAIRRLYSYYNDNYDPDDQWDEEWLLKEGNRSPLVAAIVNNFKKSPVFTQAFTDADREHFKGARDWYDLAHGLSKMYADDVKDIAGKHYPRGEIMSNVFGKLNGSNAGYAPAPRSDGKDFFDKDSLMWTNFMHDKLVEGIMGTFAGTMRQGSDPKNYRLLQAAVPLDALLRNDDVLKGRASGQRDFMNELVVNEFTPMRDIGNAGDLLGHENSPIRKYWMLRLKGANGADAWRDALGKRFGDIRYLVSDEEYKDIHKALMRDIEPLTRSAAIMRGLTRRL